nr:hypothetical protein [Kallotenue papyrolyticum]
MVTVQNFDVHAGLSHKAREQAKLTRHVLLQALNEHFAFLEDLDACGLECPAGGSSVRKEEMSHSTPVYHPSASTLDAHPGAAQSFSHFGKGAGPVF